MKSLRFVFMTAIFFFTTQAFAASNMGTGLKKVNDEGWEVLGKKMVNMGADHDEIVVTAAEGVFTKIKLVIRKAPLHLGNIRVFFKNGESENFTFDKDFAAGASTRILDLPGNKRIIKKVNLNYTTKNNNGNGRAVVVLWGKH